MPTIRETLEQIRALADAALADETPEPPLQITAIAPVLSLNGGEWVGGVSNRVRRFVVKDTADNRKAFIEGATVTLADGSKQRITKRTVDHGNIYTHIDGDGLLNAAAVGHPNTVTATADAEPAEEPEPGTKTRGALGTNIGMGQGASGKIPGVQDTDFKVAVASELRRGMAIGFTHYRVGSLYERLLKSAGGNELYRGKDAKGKPYSAESLLQFGRDADDAGARVLWNPFHNYGGVYGKKVGAAGGLTPRQFAEGMRSVILLIKSDPKAWAATHGFDIMNEWSGMSFEAVFAATQEVLNVCAEALGDKRLIVEGIHYSSTANWVKNNDGFKHLKDPRGPGFIEMSGHLYLDDDASGYYKNGEKIHPEEAKLGVTPETVGTHRLKGFADWCEQYGFHASIGETIVPGDLPRLLKGLENMIVEARRRGIDVYNFGLADWFTDTPSTHHNIEIARNKPTLEMYKRLANSPA